MRCLSLLCLTAFALMTLLLSGSGCSCGTPEVPPIPSVGPGPDPAEDSPITLVRVTAGAEAIDAVVPVAQTPDGCRSGERSEGAVLLSPDRGLADVIVALERGAQVEGAAPVPVQPVAERPLAVQDCGLVPRSLVARQGDTLVLSNGDPRFHTVHLWRVDGGRERSLQSIALAPGEQDVRFVLEQPGLYRLRSDQIPWLRGLLLVHRPVERGLVTGVDGTVEASDLPPGSWDVQLIHETLGTAETTVDIVPGASAAIYGTLPAP